MIRALLLVLLSALSASAQFTVPHRGTVASSVTGPSAFAHVASSTTGCYFIGTATTCRYNLHVNPSAGNLGIVALSWQSGTATASLSCTNNTSWTNVLSPKLGVGGEVGYAGQLFYIPSLAAGASPELCTVTISASVGFASFQYDEYSYSGTIAGTNGTPVYSTTAASGGVATISGLTTTHSSGLVYVACLGVVNTCSVGTGYTGRNDTNSCRGGTGPTLSCDGGSTGHDYNGEIGQMSEDKVGVAAGAQSATFNTSGATDDVILGMVAF